MLHSARLLLYSCLFSFALITGTHSSFCKVSYHSSQWPSSSAWSQFNETLDGQLLAPFPAAIVCDRTTVNYDQAGCQNVNQDWTNETFHANDPLSMLFSNWQLDACLPPTVFNGTCNTAPFAKYVVNATTAAHVMTAVRFASKYNLRVSVKNTGHDYLGRSTSPGFQIWTHNLNAMEYLPTFAADNCSATERVPAFTLGAGALLGHIYDFAQTYDKVITGGASAGVGLGGYFMGGGHSPLGSLYGLAVGNTLEMTVVTPDGKLKVANACQNEDLYWAMQGGGGSTFGVLISVTVKAHPNVPAVRFEVAFRSLEPSDDTFYRVLANLQSEFVNWTDNYINGYAQLGPKSAVEKQQTPILAPDNTPPTAMTYQFSGWGLNQTQSILERTIAPFISLLNASTPNITSKLLIHPEVLNASQLPSRNPEGPAGVNSILASRLWDTKAVSENQTAVACSLRALGRIQFLQQLLVTGPAVRRPELIGQTPVTPTWRKTVVHNVAATFWSARNETGHKEGRQVLTRYRDVLTERAPDMGAYLNEADADQPDREEVFWGKVNYGRLVEIKRRLDPRGMFFCSFCVGAEDWKMEGGELCRV